MMFLPKLPQIPLITITIIVLLVSGNFASLDQNCQPGSSSPRSLFLRQILDRSSYPKYPSSATPPEVPLKVGIIGAGAAGLYSAILLDSLGIDYEILEGSERVGGRIFTYRFNQTAWDASTPEDPDYYDYYDVGAMRFPGMDVEYMNRVIGTANNSLIPYVNSLVKNPRDKIVKIPYIFTANSTFRLYNNILQYNQVPPTADLFNTELADNGTVDAAFADLNPSAVWTNVTSQMTEALTKNFTQGFDLLMNYDAQSVRAYLLGQGFTGPQVDWMETINDATDHYDTFSMSQGAMEQWIFSEGSVDNWTCINGGMDRLSNGMLQIIKHKPLLKSPVTAILPTKNGTLGLLVNGTEERRYAHIISTVSLGALQTLDLTKLDMNFAQRNAIRKLSYDPAMKIGMKFKSRWWENLPMPFQGGQSYSDVPIRRCVYPSYGLKIPQDKAPGTMIASYVWGQDSMRLGAYLKNSEARDRLIEITLQDLAAMNNVTYEFLKTEFVDYHTWDWYQDEWSVGAFAMFSPDKFSNVMPALMTPGEDGHLHWGGEALSSGHAWIIGAVNSAYRCVVEILKAEKRDDLIEQLVRNWGRIDEVDMGWYTTSDIGGP